MNDSLWDCLVVVSVVVTILALVSMPVTCTMYEDKLIAQEIKDGVPPLNAMCAHTTRPFDHGCRSGS